MFGLGFAFFDQLSKVFVQSNGGFAISLNDGVAFSIMVPMWIQVSLSSVLLTTIIIFAQQIVFLESTLKRRKLAIFGLSLIFGGGLGNLMDRINYGYVVDFIDVGFWPVFNLADTFISVGAVILAVLWLKK